MVQDHFWKIAVLARNGSFLAQKSADFGREPAGPAPPPQEAISWFLAQKSDLARAPPWL